MAPKQENIPTDNRKKMNRRRLFFDCAQLVIALFVPLAIIAYTIMQNNTETSIAKQNRLQDLQIAEERHEQDILLAEDEQEEATLVHYFDSLGKLLEKNDKLENQTNIARFKTLTALAQLKCKRKGFLIRSLIENDLITLHNGKTVILDLALADLTGLDLTNNMLVNNEMVCVKLSQTTLTNSSFRHMGLHGTTFAQSTLVNSDFSLSYAYRWSCGSAQTYGADFRFAALENSIFDRAVYRKAYFSDSKLSHARMNRFKCYDCEFFNTSMIRTDLTGAQFLSESRERSNMQSINMTLTLLHKTEFIHIDFAQTKLSKVNATETIFNDTNFMVATVKHTKFIQSIIIDSSFTRVNFTGSSFHDTKINNTIFTVSDMTNISFINSECHYCLFNQTDLTGAIFTNSSLDGSDFTLTNISYEQIFAARSFKNVLFPNETIFQSLNN